MNKLIINQNIRLLNKIVKRTFLTAQFKELSQLEKLSNTKFNNYESLHKFSIERPEMFWSTLARSRLDWFKDFTQVTSGSFKNFENFNLKWFLDGKINVTYNCVDRHYKSTPDKIALIWEKDEPGTEEYLTYKELYKKVNQVANMLKAHQIKKGDRVAIYMSNTLMTAVSMLACAKIGAVHVFVFAGFSAESLSSRINDAQCKAVITLNQSLRGGKPINLKETTDLAVKSCPTVNHVFVFRRTQNDFEKLDKDVIVDDLINYYSNECEPEVMDSDDPLLVLYTSGSTGKPKGLVHSQAGYLLQSALSLQMVFNYKPNEIFGCFTDLGWVTGHTYAAYGPLCNGGTSVLFESTPTYPDPGRYWETIERLKVNHLYTAPTVIRVLLKYEDNWVKKYDLSSLKSLGVVGEPTNHEAWKWYHEVVGEKRCKIADTWFQSEMGSISITPTPCDKDAEILPSMAMRPFFGIQPVLLNDKGKEIEMKNNKGILCVKQPWPSMARSIIGDHKRYIETYLKPYPGYYFTGDGACADKNGFIQITGRVDDVLNVSGHRIGTAELEDALATHSDIAESAIVGYPHETIGEGIYAYVVLKNNAILSEETLIKELNELVKKKISSYAVPHKILIVPNLPKTTSGKTMRRILRKIATNNINELGDVTTLSDPSVVGEIVELHQKKFVKN